MQGKVKGKGFEVVCHVAEVPSDDPPNLGKQGTCFEKYFCRLNEAVQCKMTNECNVCLNVIIYDDIVFFITNKRFVSGTKKSKFNTWNFFIKCVIICVYIGIQFLKFINGGCIVY